MYTVCRIIYVVQMVERALMNTSPSMPTVELLTISHIPTVELLTNKVLLGTRIVRIFCEQWECSNCGETKIKKKVPHVRRPTFQAAILLQLLLLPRSRRRCLQLEGSVSKQAASNMVLTLFLVPTYSREVWVFLQRNQGASEVPGWADTRGLVRFDSCK